MNLPNLHLKQSSSFITLLLSSYFAAFATDKHSSLNPSQASHTLWGFWGCFSKTLKDVLQAICKCTCFGASFIRGLGTHNSTNYEGLVSTAACKQTCLGALKQIFLAIVNRLDSPLSLMDCFYTYRLSTKAVA